jgi:hypothetical protein
MRKIRTGIVFAIIVLAGVGSYSLTLQAQQRVEQQMTGAFAALRGALGSGNVGKIEVDLLRRTFKVSDIVLQSDGPRPTILKIRELTGTGIDLPAQWRLSAGRIEALDVEVVGSIDVPPGMAISYKAPRITLTDYSGPMVALRQVNAASKMDVARLVLEHIVATAATSVSVPTLMATMTPTVAPTALGTPVIGPLTYTYSDLALRGIRDGRVAEMTVGSLLFTMVAPADTVGKITGDAGKFSVSDFDAGALLALLDPATAKDDRPVRLYGRTTSGPYSLRFEKGGDIRVEGFSLDHVTVRPAKLRIAELMELSAGLAPSAGRPPSPAAVRELAGKIADIYEGISIGQFEFRGMSLNMPQTPPFKLGAVRISGLENGRFAEIAVEGLEGQTPQMQPVKVGRFALKGLDISGIARLAGQFDGAKPTPEQIASLMGMLEGIEIKGVVAPYKDTKGTVSIETFSVSWGQFVGPIPTAARVTARISGPLELTDPDILQLLAGAGFTTATVGFDLGTAWTEATRIFALTPVSLEVSNLFSATARVSVGNVPREIFSLDPDQALLAAAQVQAGMLEFVLKDAGALDLALAQFASKQGMPAALARMVMIEALNQSAAQMLQGNPDLKPAVDAIARFIEAPRGTLTIRVIPKGRVVIQQAIEAAKGDPAALLSQFRIEVTADR